MPNIVVDKARATAFARNLSSHLKSEHEFDLQHTAALKAIAGMLGYSSLNAFLDAARGDSPSISLNATDRDLLAKAARLMNPSAPELGAAALRDHSLSIARRRLITELVIRLIGLGGTKCVLNFSNAEVGLQADIALNETDKASLLPADILSGLTIEDLCSPSWKSHVPSVGFDGAFTIPNGAVVKFRHDFNAEHRLTFLSLDFEKSTRSFKVQPSKRWQEVVLPSGADISAWVTEQAAAISPDLPGRDNFWTKGARRTIAIVSHFWLTRHLVTQADRTGLLKLANARQLINFHDIWEEFHREILALRFDSDDSIYNGLTAWAREAAHNGEYNLANDLKGLASMPSRTRTSIIETADLALDWEKPL